MNSFNYKLCWHLLFLQDKAKQADKMKHQVSPKKDISFLVTDEDIAHLEKHVGNQSYRDFSIESTNRDPDELFSAFLGCSDSRMFKKVPLVNGFHVVPPSPIDEIYLVNIRPEIIKTVKEKGEYSAVYAPESNATVTIKREVPNAQQPS